MVSFQNYVDSGDRHIQKSESSFAETVRHAKTARYSPWHCIYLLFAENMPYTETAHNHTVAHLFHFIYIWFFLHCASHTHCCVRAKTSRRPLAWAVRKCICCERQPRNWMWILVYLFSSASKLVLHAAAHTQSSAYIHPLRLTMLLLDLVWKKKQRQALAKQWALTPVQTEAHSFANDQRCSNVFFCKNSTKQFPVLRRTELCKEQANTNAYKLLPKAAVNKFKWKKI